MVVSILYLSLCFVLGGTPRNSPSLEILVGRTWRPPPWALVGPLPGALEGPLPWALEEPLPWALEGPLGPWKGPLPWALEGPLPWALEDPTLVPWRGLTNT